MKSITSIFFPVLFASSVFAIQAVQLLEGKEAEELLHALRRVGASTECGRGVCSILVTEVTCSSTKSHPVSSAACSLNVHYKDGASSEKQLKGPRASKLVEILMEAGTVVCGLESCQGSADSIECVVEKNSQRTAESIQCSID